VQFSRFSVKEYLTSARLATSSQDVLRYHMIHIVLEPAHTILAQACLSILLRLDSFVEQSNVEERIPLAGYSAEHWVRPAQFDLEDVASHIKGRWGNFEKGAHLSVCTIISPSQCEGGAGSQKAGEAFCGFCGTEKYPQEQLQLTLDKRWDYSAYYH
jgi:hypothetical protein